MGSGEAADFAAFYTPGLPTFSPHFVQAWGQVNAQLNLEGASTDVINSATQRFSGAFSQLANNATDELASSIAGASRDVTLAFHSITSAVGMVESLAGEAVSGIEAAIVGDAQGAIHAFMGVMVTVGVGVGSITAGAGAAITATLGATLSLLQAAGLFGPPAPAAVLCGFPINSPPDFTIGCLGVWVDVGQPKQIAPGTQGSWRNFPDPSKPEDAAWFGDASTGAGPGEWKGAFFGIDKPGANQHYSQGNVPNPAAPTDRPIDNAFPAFFEIESLKKMLDTSSTDIYAQFYYAFIAAWRANAEFALNGLQPQPDENVLVHTLRVWNTAHDSSATQPLNPPPTCVYANGSWAPSNPECLDPFLNTIVNQLVIKAHATGKINDLWNGSGFTVNIGPRKQAVVAAALAAPLPPDSSGPTVAQLNAARLAANPPSVMSAPAKVVAGTAVVGGAAIVGTVVYAFAKGQAVDAVLKSVWRAVKGAVWR